MPVGKIERIGRPKPQWGVDEVVEVVPFALSDETILRLLEFLGVVDALDRRTVRDQLDDIATDHRTWRAQFSAAPRRAESNAALAEIRDGAAALEFKLRGLDDRAGWELMLKFRPAITTDAEGVPGPDRLSRLTNELRELSRAARTAWRESAKVRGSEGDRDLHVTVERLVDLYDDSTGTRATHHASEGSVYDGAPQSRAGKFLLAFFAETEPDLPETRISGALMRLIRRRNKARSEHTD